MINKFSTFFRVSILAIVFISFAHASENNDDKTPFDPGQRPKLSTRFYSFIRDNLQRSHERVVKRQVTHMGSFFIHSFNSASPFGDTIDVRDLLAFRGRDFFRENDTRQEVTDLRKHPYFNIGLLAAHDPIEDALLFGTASKISDRHILTAAHNLVDCSPQKRIYKKPQYFSGFNKGQYLDNARIKRFFIPEDYCQGGCDIAIAELERSIHPSTFLSLVFLPSEELKHKPIRVIGYPSDLNKRNPSAPVMFEDMGKVVKVSQFEFTHDANTHQGNSGGPVLFEEEIDITLNKAEDRVKTPSSIIGVHIAGPSDTVENDMNHATMISRVNYDMINQLLSGNRPKWMEEFIIEEGDKDEKK